MQDEHVMSNLKKFVDWNVAYATFTINLLQMSLWYCFCNADIVYSKLINVSYFSPALSPFPSFQVSLGRPVSLQNAIYLTSQPYTSIADVLKPGDPV